METSSLHLFSASSSTPVISIRSSSISGNSICFEGAEMSHLCHAGDDADDDKLEPGNTLQGMPGCPGLAEGRARVILDSNDPTELEPGDILIAPITDPSWTPLFVPAAAVVVDVGAPLSHAIIVSRELGIPCVVSATDATRKIPNGALVQVNGDSGVVTVLEE